MNAPAISGSNTPALPTSPVRLPISRNIVIAASVVIFHVAALWALQNGLLRRAVEQVVPAELLTRIIEIEPPKVAPPPPPPPPRPAPKTVKLPPPPMPVAIRDPAPAPHAPTGVIEPQPPAPVVLAPVAPAPAPPAPPAPARLVEITQGETEYIRPPRPVYPALSKRSGEAGVVIIAVYYSTSGHARRAEVFKSSGFERLDRAAREAVMASQVTPFRRAGVNDDTQFLLKAPINFVLE
ncbi:energy transducer TonB [Polaromonas sp.]|uniref:energy transducer TonB n=1 Tax=Polaromonas sp. TaxID=1869339 RepID=UPI00248A532C|nr:energy transducer TonB [Polaromonas sp.]MDI1341681.1 energy transducer TonB [Polaromonas sp.]